VHYPTKFLLVGFGDGLALGVGSLTQNVDDDLFIRTESFHGSSPMYLEKKFKFLISQKATMSMLYTNKKSMRKKKTFYNAWASATGSKLAAGSTVGTSYTHHISLVGLYWRNTVRSIYGIKQSLC
jgi:hypothetical protein